MLSQLREGHIRLEMTFANLNKERYRWKLSRKVLTMGAIPSLAATSPKVD